MSLKRLCLIRVLALCAMVPGFIPVSDSLISSSGGNIIVNHLESKSDKSYKFSIHKNKLNNKLNNYSY